MEIDDRVIEVAKKYLPFMACGFDSKKVHLTCGDGFEYMKQRKGEFDVIITDSSDPIGPAKSLFQVCNSLINYISNVSILTAFLIPGVLLFVDESCIETEWHRMLTRWNILDEFRSCERNCRQLSRSISSC